MSTLFSGRKRPQGAGRSQGLFVCLFVFCTFAACRALNRIKLKCHGNVNRELRSTDTALLCKLAIKLWLNNCVVHGPCSIN